MGNGVDCVVCNDACDSRVLSWQHARSRRRPAVTEIMYSRDEAHVPEQCLRPAVGPATKQLFDLVNVADSISALISNAYPVMYYCWHHELVHQEKLCTSFDEHKLHHLSICRKALAVLCLLQV